MTKAEIKDRFYELKKWGYVFHNFQFPKRMPYGARGFCDLHIICPGDFVLYVDIKTKNDKPTEAQIKFRSDVNTMLSRALHLWGTDENIDRLLNIILQKQYHLLREAENTKG